VASQLFRFSDLYDATRPGGPHRIRGLAVLRAHLEWVGYLGAPAPSVLESLTARMFRDHGLVRPKVEVATGDHGQYRVDFAYPHLMLAIEVDGYIWHSGRERFERDLARRNQLQAMGWTVLVFTWRQVVEDPDGIAAEIVRTHRRLSQAA
jgi:very-short-patch-repair endonuclease